MDFIGFLTFDCDGDKLFKEWKPGFLPPVETQLFGGFMLPVFHFPPDDCGHRFGQSSMVAT